MPRDAFVAKLYLDLDSGLVDTPLRLNGIVAVRAIWDAHHSGAFGLVSLGRFLVEIDVNGADWAPPVIPAFVKTAEDGHWVPNPELLGVLSSRHNPSIALEIARRALDRVTPYGNRGPVMRGLK